MKDSVRVWRIVQKPFAKTAFAGAGAKRYPGRWNSEGIPMVYTSGSVALATLETLVHLDSESDISDFRLFGVDIPTGLIEIAAVKKLPNGWDCDQVPDEVREFGSKWFLGQRSLALCVPSAVVPHEFNYLLNPTHTEFANLKIGRAEKFDFDPRLISYPPI